MPRKTLKQRRQENRGRFSSGIDFSGIKDPDELMMNIMEILKDDIEYAPDNIGAMYTFIYQPKTPNILYDEHPLVEITEITRWGFRGFNYHWNAIRNYTFPEVIGPMHRLYPEELNYLRTISYKKIRST